MKSWTAFFKKELLECVRSGKIVILGVLFILFGIMNPAIAKLTPWLFELLSDSLAESGMIFTEITIDALTSWTQFFKNVPIVLIVFILLYSGIFTKEYESGTLILVLTKGLSRYKVVLAKSALLFLLWTIGYWLCFAVTYGYNAYFWDNGIAIGLLPAAAYWWLFGIWVVCLIVFFSVLCHNYHGVLLGTGGSVLGAYIIGLFPRFSEYTPTALMNGAFLLTGSESADIYVKAIVITVVMGLVCFFASIPIMNKKQL